MECNFLEKKSGRICRIILFRIFRNRLPETDDFRSNSDERARQRQIPHNTQIFL
jgi:hypothetical protein